MSIDIPLRTRVIATVWGRNYGSRDDMQARMEELRQLNLKYGKSDDRVTERNALIEWLNAHAPQPAPAPVFYAYYRTADGKKGYREWKTREGLSRFIMTTNHAVTAHN